MEEFFKIVLIFIAASIVLRMAAKLMLPWLLRYTAKRMMHRMGMQPEDQAPKKSGSITVEEPPKAKNQNRNLDNLGDYTDYEEVK
jgi:hypothetical protein